MKNKQRATGDSLPVLQVRGSRCDLNDLPSLDPELYDNLLKLTSMNVEDLNLTFTISTEAYGDGREVELINGVFCLSAPKNKIQYFFF